MSLTEKNTIAEFKSWLTKHHILYLEKQKKTYYTDLFYKNRNIPSQSKIIRSTKNIPTIADLKHQLELAGKIVPYGKRKQFYLDMVSDISNPNIPKESFSPRRNMILEEPEKYTIPKLISWLTQVNVELPSTKQRKSFYIEMVYAHNNRIIHTKPSREITKQEPELYVPKPGSFLPEPATNPEPEPGSFLSEPEPFLSEPEPFIGEIEKDVIQEQSDVEQLSPFELSLPQILTIKKRVTQTCFFAKETSNEAKLHILKLVYACLRHLNVDKNEHDSHLIKIKKLMVKDIINTHDYCSILTPVMNNFDFELWTHNLDALRDHGITLESLKKLDKMTDEEEMHIFLQKIYNKKTKNITKKPRTFAKMLGAFVLGTFILAAAGGGAHYLTTQHGAQNAGFHSGANTGFHSEANPEFHSEPKRSYPSQEQRKQNIVEEAFKEYEESVKETGYASRATEDLFRYKTGYRYPGNKDYSQKAPKTSKSKFGGEYPTPQEKLINFDEYKLIHPMKKSSTRVLHPKVVFVNEETANVELERNYWKKYITYLSKHYFPQEFGKYTEEDINKEVNADVLFKMYRKIQTKLHPDKNPTPEEKLINEQLIEISPTREEIKEYFGSKHKYSKEEIQKEYQVPESKPVRVNEEEENEMPELV